MRNCKWKMVLLLAPLWLFSYCTQSRIELSDQPGLPQDFQTERNIGLGGCEIRISGSQAAAGLPVSILFNGKQAAKGRLEENQGTSEYRFLLPLSDGMEVWPRIEVRVSGKLEAEFESIETMERIRARYREAIGAPVNHERISSRICRGKWINNYTDDPSNDAGTPLDVVSALPDRWKAELHIEEGVYREGYDGKVGWRLSSDRIEEIPRLTNTRFGLIMSPRGFLEIDALFQDMRLLTRKSIEGRPVYILKPRDSNWTFGELAFDAETGLLSKIGDTWEFEDYREKDGIMFPHRLVVGRRGGTGAYVFDRVEHNRPVDDQIFSKPSHEEIFPEAFQGIDDDPVISMLTTVALTYVHEDMNVPVRDGRFLHDFIVENKYQRGLEIGTFTGYSTLWMGLAFRQTGGQIVTIEIDPETGKIASDNIKKAGLDDIVDARIGDAFRVIPAVEGRFDFIFIDAWKTDYLKFFQLVRDRLEPGGALIAHNVTNYARDMQDFLEAVQSDPDLTTTFNTLSGEGMSISIVKKLTR